MKKKNKKLLIILGIIILALLILNSSGIINLGFTILSHASYVNVGNLGNGVWQLSGADPNANPVAGILSSEGKFNFIINKWDGSTRQDARTAFRLNAITFNSEVQSFLSSHSSVNNDQTACRYGVYQPFDSGWDSRIGVAEYNLGYGNMGWCLSETTVGNILDNSFMVFEGYYLTDCNTRVNVRTYGMCTAGTNCWMIDPAPEVGGSLGDCGMGVLTPTSWKLYFKEGGYTEETGKSQFGFNVIPPITLFRFESNQCSEISILESAKTTNDYDSLSECQNHITINQTIPLNETQIDENNSVYCQVGFTYNSASNKCENYPISSNICTVGNYNSLTGKCEVNPEVKYLSVDNFLTQKLFNLGNFEVNGLIFIIGLVSIFVILYSLGGKR